MYSLHERGSGGPVALRIRRSSSGLVDRAGRGRRANRRQLLHGSTRLVCHALRRSAKPEDVNFQASWNVG